MLALSILTSSRKLLISSTVVAITFNPYAEPIALTMKLIQAHLDMFIPVVLVRDKL